jgi:hypothetical protein
MFVSSGGLFHLSRRRNPEAEEGELPNLKELSFTPPFYAELLKNDLIAKLL